MEKKERKKYKTAEFPVADDSKPKKRGQLWCPYEGKWSFFKAKPVGNEGLGYPRCEGCNISTEDYYVKSANHLWGDISVKPRG